MRYSYRLVAVQEGDEIELPHGSMIQHSTVRSTGPDDPRMLYLDVLVPIEVAKTAKPTPPRDIQGERLREAIHRCGVLEPDTLSTSGDGWTKVTDIGVDERVTIVLPVYDTTMPSAGGIKYYAQTNVSGLDSLVIGQSLDTRIGPMTKVLSFAFHPMHGWYVELAMVDRALITSGLAGWKRLLWANVPWN